MITVLTPELLDDAAAVPNGESEAVLEDIVFRTYNGGYDETALKPVLKALWYAFVRREDPMVIEVS